MLLLAKDGSSMEVFSASLNISSGMAIRTFAGIGLTVEAVPDATTLLNLRKRLVAHDLTRKLFDVSLTHALLHGHEDDAFSDAGCAGVHKRDDMQGKSVKWHVATKHSKINAMRDGASKELRMQVKHTTPRIRTRVEHSFHVIKNLSGHRKVRYKGLAKDSARLFGLFGPANLVLAKTAFLASAESNPSWARQARQEVGQCRLFRQKSSSNCIRFPHRGKQMQGGRQGPAQVPLSVIS